MNHRTRQTSWQPPEVLSRPLPPSWEARADPQSGRTYYVNHANGSTHWEIPESAYQTATPASSANGPAPPSPPIQGNRSLFLMVLAERHTSFSLLKRAQPLSANFLTRSSNARPLFALPPLVPTHWRRHPGSTPLTNSTPADRWRGEPGAAAAAVQPVHAFLRPDRAPARHTVRCADPRCCRRPAPRPPAAAAVPQTEPIAEAEPSARLRPRGARGARLGDMRISLEVSET